MGGFALVFWNLSRLKCALARARRQEAALRRASITESRGRSRYVCACRATLALYLLNFGLETPFGGLASAGTGID
jgi:hypothetical protein